MRAVVFDDVLKFEPDLVLDPDPADGVCVDVIQAGICETDLQLCQGYMGFRGVLGHEFVGIARTGTHAGRRVVGEINCGCESCSWCRRKLQNHCPSRTVVGILNHSGAFADTVVIPESNLHVIPDNVSDDEAVFVEPLAAACRIPQQVELQSGSKTLVLGAGRLGNLCAQVLKHHHCDVVVRGRHEPKLNLLRELDIAAGDASESLPPQSFDLVVDCTGSESGLADALSFVRPLGTVVMKTTVAAPHSLNLADIVIHEIRLVGSRCGPFDDAISMLQQRQVQVTQLISARYPLEQAVDAMEQAARRDMLKVLLDVNTSSRN